MAEKMDEDISMLNGVYGEGDDDLDNLFGGSDDGFDDGFVAENVDIPTNGLAIDDVNPNQTIPPPDDGVGTDELAALSAEGRVGEGDEEVGLELLNELNSRPLELGEKADNAIDYEDIGEDDDDLAEEEDPSGSPVRPAGQPWLSGIEESAAEPDFDDDLFGDGGDDDDVNSSFMAPRTDGAKSDAGHGRDDVDSVASEQKGEAGRSLMAQLDERDDEMTEEEQRQFRLQMALLQGRQGDDMGPAGIDDMDFWLSTNYPGYSHDDEAPFWNKLLPPRLGKLSGKEPKRPKIIKPLKPTLDVEPDQRTQFTAPATIAVSIEPRPDLVWFTAGRDHQKLDSLVEDDSDDEMPNGLTIEDLDMMCTDFDTLSHLADEDAQMMPEPRIVGVDATSDDHEMDFPDSDRPFKKRKTGLNAHDLVTIHQFDMPSFDDPEKLTARLAREVVLDLNDPSLLVEELDQDVQRLRIRSANNPTKGTTVKERLARRFKTSNDATYAQLQQNQKKVRGQLTNMTIDHSLPAVILQYPYYQVKLTSRDLRTWHRKHILFKSGIAFSKLNKFNQTKRKELKSKPIREGFAKTRDLSVADNSKVVLLEYSEEHPIMLSQTGMGNKIVNYYRKTHTDDTTRPKVEIGDIIPLMPEDKSPFNNFGHIDAGQTTMAVYNTLFRAPIFEQQRSSNDFLIVREVTGLNGQIHYLRNIDYQYVVGQELPTQPVPGPHARMVTTVSKNRLKAISFRIARRKKSHRLRVEEVTRHFPETNDMQNRQKMKEFMVFSKEHKEWEMKGNEPIPDEEAIQKSLTPEDICLLESMQVGSQYLHDAGFADEDVGDKEGKDDDDDDDKDDKQGLSIEQQLAPWRTTKNFIAATQGKAMLQLYGEGDPSGRGEAFSFIRTSMKGGFRAQGMSTNETLSKRDTGGHTYNVARQQESYNNSIRSIWDKQKAVLSERSQPTMVDEEGVDAMDAVSRRGTIRATPVSGMHTPSGRRRDDETGTSFSKRSATSQAQKFLRIKRKVWTKDDVAEWREVIESDPAVIKLYLKRKEQMENKLNISELIPTGDPEVDARSRARIEEELARLEKTKNNRGRGRGKKNRASEVGTAGSPNADGEDPGTPSGAPVSGGRNTQATQRKCANCGQVGHIKTNKKLVNIPCKNCGASIVSKAKSSDFGMSIMMV